jgi:hypothetical protein
VSLLEYRSIAVDEIFNDVISGRLLIFYEILFNC